MSTHSCPIFPNRINPLEKPPLACIMQIKPCTQQQGGLGPGKKKIMLKGLGCFRFASNGFCIVVLCHGKEQGRDFYAFIAIEPHNYRYFQKRYRPGEDSTFTAYGFELARGWGKEPPETMTRYMLERHGVEFGVSDHFLSRVIDNLAPVAAPLGRQYFANLAAAQAQAQQGV